MPKLFALLLLALCTASQAQSAEKQVRAARAASNQAWAARDLQAYAATITQDFVITSGNGAASQHDNFLAMLGKAFRSEAGQRCVRTPEKIELSLSRPLAAEHGHWQCESIQPDGKLVATGTYLAMWRHEGETWRTRSELFVTLACSGSVACKP